MRLTFLFAVLLAACATTGPGDRAEIDRVLDDFHDAAAKADLERYFSHLASNGVFLGTDATERWEKSSFRAFVHPHFAKGQGWTYKPRDRHIDVSGGFAWFDELLDNESYGEVRGSGALQRTGATWKILQYNLAFTIPNDKAKQVVELIRPR